MELNKVCAIQQFAANGESSAFRIGASLELQGRVAAAGAVAATITLKATNTPGDANSWVDVGVLVLAGNPSASGTKRMVTNLAWAKMVVTGLTGTLDASVGAGADGPTASDEAPLPIKTGASQNFQVQIANGQSLSAVLDLGNYRLGRIGLPASFEGTKLSFQTSHDGVTFRDLYDAFGEYTTVAGASRSVVPDLTMFASARYLKIRSGTSASPSVVGAARTLDITTLA